MFKQLMNKMLFSFDSTWNPFWENKKVVVQRIEKLLIETFLEELLNSVKSVKVDH